MTWLLATPVLFGLFGLLIIFMAITIELEKTRWVNGLFSVGVFLVIWHYRHDMWAWISANPIDTIIFTLSYIAGGLVWSVIKWKSYISRSARHFKYLKEKFSDEVGQIGGNWRTWISWLHTDRYKLKLNNAVFSETDEPEQIINKITISPKEKKGVIITWIAYWPMSFLATILNDPIRRFASWIYGLFSGIYSKMSKHEVKGLEKGMERHEESEQKDRKPVA